MKTSHAGMRITEEEFNAAAGHLVAALKKFGVPQAETDDLAVTVVRTRVAAFSTPCSGRPPPCRSTSTARSCPVNRTIGSALQL